MYMLLGPLLEYVGLGKQGESWTEYVKSAHVIAAAAATICMHRHRHRPMVDARGLLKYTGHRWRNLEKRKVKKKLTVYVSPESRSLSKMKI